MSKEISKENAREIFLDKIRESVKYWSKLKNIPEERLEELAFSILVIFDGETDLPAFDIVVRPHPDDKAYNIENDEDYYVDGMVINDDVMLHDLWYKDR